MENTLKLMKSLSDEIRLRIINILYYSDLYVCEIVDILKLPQSTVSRHLTIMKNTNVIEDTKDGSWIKYSIVKNDSYNNIVKNIIEKELINDNKLKCDIENMKIRIKCPRGCKGKC
ncbi:MAG: metalloregulator ArsR/SmtB family transcription factor [Clostridia bacterium]|nr:metalloregulator ArsR/SmtB family transcription factor [Clostridia bacterium]MDD4387065.1 metalloregulator ArsR/SmtB family transcription factor [Clostridia bacterium]